MTTDSEVGQAHDVKPAHGHRKVSDGHYVLVVVSRSDSASEGLTLYQLATFMSEHFGLRDGLQPRRGGSSTLYYDGEVVNNPTTNGDRISERSVSDIVYLTT